MDYKEIARNIFIEAVRSVQPHRLINDHVRTEGDVLSIDDLRLSLNSFRNIYVIGTGKASASMGQAMEEILGEKISGGHIIVKYGHSANLERISVTEAGHPIPDTKGFRATESIIRFAEKTTGSDLVFCLLSGGGSALMSDCPDGLTEGELMDLNDLLVRSGADIREINTVRKHLSDVKGGRLARLLSPSTIINLIISDVPGDLPEIIASGPTYPDTTTFRQAFDIIHKYYLQDKVAPSVIDYLTKGMNGIIKETPRPEDPVFKNVNTFLLGTNKTAVEAARLKAVKSGLVPWAIDCNIHGDTVEISKILVETAIRYQKTESNPKPACLLFGGETTVRVTGAGIGGRNQHLALSCAILLAGHTGITVLAAGTDGSDGPTDAAGGVVDGNTYNTAITKGIDPQKYLNEFNSYHFFENTAEHVMTGPTRTNVMDIIVVVIE
jgi:glycerate 2-kinase